VIHRFLNKFHCITGGISGKHLEIEEKSNHAKHEKREKISSSVLVGTTAYFRTRLDVFIQFKIDLIIVAIILINHYFSIDITVMKFFD